MHSLGNRAEYVAFLRNRFSLHSERVKTKRKQANEQKTAVCEVPARRRLRWRRRSADRFAARPEFERTMKNLSNCNSTNCFDYLRRLLGLVDSWLQSIPIGLVEWLKSQQTTTNDKSTQQPVPGVAFAFQLRYPRDRQSDLRRRRR